jgi:hypothetical protein
MSGAGPVYATNFGVNASHSDLFSYYDVVWVTAPAVTGLVLVRGFDAENHRIPIVYVGPNVGGGVLGIDTVNGKPVVQRAELVLDASHHPAASGNSEWGIYDARAGLSTRISGCHAFQIDGEGFSEVIVTNPG